MLKSFTTIGTAVALVALVSVACLADQPVSYELDGHKYNCEALFIIRLDEEWGMRPMHSPETGKLIQVSTWKLQTAYELSEEEAREVNSGCRRALWNAVRPLPK